MAGAQGRSGRKPKPVAIKELTKNPGKRKLNKAQPAFTALTAIDVPDWIVEAKMENAIIMWRLLSRELCVEGLLCVTDLSILERWCVAYEIWRRAVKNIAEQGNTIESASGAISKKPELTAKKEQESEMNTVGAILGLDPSSRQRLIGQASKQTNTNPFSQLL